MSKTPPPPPPPAPRNVPIGDDVHLEPEPANEGPRRTAWVHVSIDLAGGEKLELTVPGVAGAVAGYQPEIGEGPALYIVKNGQRRRAKLGPLLGGT